MKQLFSITLLLSVSSCALNASQRTYADAVKGTQPQEALAADSMPDSMPAHISESTVLQKEIANAEQLKEQKAQELAALLAARQQQAALRAEQERTKKEARIEEIKMQIEEREDRIAKVNAYRQECIARYTESSTKMATNHETKHRKTIELLVQELAQLQHAPVIAQQPQSEAPTQQASNEVSTPDTPAAKGLLGLGFFGL